MIAYYALFVLPLLGHLLRRRLNPQLDRFAWTGMVIIACLIVGLRFDVGCDWKGYWIIYEVINGENTGSFYHNYINPSSFIPIIKEGALYLGLNWIVGKLSLGLVTVNLICATLALLGLSAFCRALPFPWLGWLIATPYLITVVAIGYTRQSVAIGLICWALACARNHKVGQYLILALLAASFHISAILFLSLIPFFFQLTFRNYYTRSPGKAILLTSALAISLLFLLWATFNEDFVRYTTQTSYHSRGSLYRSFLTAVPSFLLLFYGRFIYTNEQVRYPIFIVLACVALCFFPISFFWTTLIDRLGLYLIPIQMFFWTHWLATLRHNSAISTATSLLVLVYAGLLVGWLYLADNSNCWIHYQNYLFL